MRRNDKFSQGLSVCWSGSDGQNAVCILMETVSSFSSVSSFSLYSARSTPPIFWTSSRERSYSYLRWELSRNAWSRSEYSLTGYSIVSSTELKKAAFMEKQKPDHETTRGVQIYGLIIWVFWVQWNYNIFVIELINQQSFSSIKTQSASQRGMKERGLGGNCNEDMI